MSGVYFVIRVFIISCNSSCAFLPFAEAVIRPTGLSENTVVETHHSMAFLSPLGILKTYSGVQIRIPSASSMFRLKFKIDVGVSLTESSGSKWGGHGFQDS